MKFCTNLMRWMTVLLVLASAAQSRPMTNDEEHLVALDSVEEQTQLQSQSQPFQSPHISRIASKVEQPEQFNTFVEELKAAGVQPANQQDLQTLSYKELTRLLGMWHMSQERNFYEAKP